MNQLTLGNMLERKAAEVKGEALGRIRVATAGILNNCFHSVMKQSFSYEASAPSTSADVMETEEPSSVPPRGTRPRGVFPRRPPAATASGSASEAESQHLSPKTTGAKAFKPGPNKKTWTKTGLASDLVPIKITGDENYHCPFPDCDYPGKQKLDTVATHIRRDHLNICMACYYCDGLFWSGVSWGKHCSSLHGGLDPVPVDAKEPEVFDPLSESEIIEIKQEEADAIQEALGMEDMSVEPELSIVTEVIP